MQIETRFSNGDKAWTSVGGIAHEITIGQVRVEITDSPGREGEETFDNYKPQKDRVESYMAVESGIRTGSVYTLGVHIFATKEEAQAAIEEALARP